MKSITIRLQSEIWQKFKEVTQSRGMTMNTAIRLLIADYLKEKEV